MDDIPDGPHKSFIRQYLRDWPYPHLTKYRVGQNLSAEYNGEQQRCEVHAVDCSLMQVIFQVSIYFFFFFVFTFLCLFHFDLKCLSVAITNNTKVSPKTSQQ